MKPQVISFIRKCTSVSQWGWFDTNLGFLVRKRLGDYSNLTSDLSSISGNEIPDSLAYKTSAGITRKSLWQRVKDYFNKLFK